MYHILASKEVKSKKRIDFVEVEEALTRENYKSKSYQISRFLWSFATNLSVQHYCLEYNAIEKPQVLKDATF